MDNYKELLRLVQNWSNEYDTRVKNAGFDFNIFSVMGKERDEVNLHSAFIAELLNPQGSHNMGKLFLEKFIAQLGINFDTTSRVKVYVEKDIGRISEDKETGGRIDILISNLKKQEIIIENKIDATDQEKQLVRYHNYNFQANLYYLTKQGTTPSESSIKGDTYTLNEGEDFKCISYSNDIIDWLEECRRYIPMNTIFSATFTQYLNTLKKLTGKPLLPDMKENLQKMIKDNLKECLLIEEQLDDIKTEIQLDFWEALTSQTKQNFPNNEIIPVDSSAIKNYYAKSVKGKGIKVTLDENLGLYWYCFVENNIYVGFYSEKNQDTLRHLVVDDLGYTEQSENYLGWKYTQYEQDLNFREFNSDLIIEISEKSSKMKEVVQEIISDAKKDIYDLLNKINGSKTSHSLGTSRR